MTIDEAYQSMLEGNKVTHYSYTPKEYNYIEHGMIKDEGKHVWGTRLDYPWHSRKTEEILSFFRDGWKIYKEPIKETPEQELLQYQKKILKDISDEGHLITAGHPRHKGELYNIVAEKIREYEKQYMHIPPIVNAHQSEEFLQKYFKQKRVETLEVDLKELANKIKEKNKTGEFGFTVAKNRALNNSTWNLTTKKLWPWVKGSEED